MTQERDGALLSYLHLLLLNNILSTLFIVHKNIKCSVSAATGSSHKSLNSQKENELDLIEITSLEIFASKFVVLLEMIYLFTPKNL